MEESTGAELSLPQTGLMVACYHGFQSVVALLSRCPFLDVNQQDKEGDTALMLAAQAGERLLTPPFTKPHHPPTPDPATVPHSLHRRSSTPDAALLGGGCLRLCHPFLG